MRVLFLLTLIASLTAGLGIIPGRTPMDGLVAVAAAQEHPEHPGVEGAEHPEHPAPKKEPVTIESVAVFLEGYVAEEAKAHDGWYRIEDEKAGRTLELRLDKIHRERLAKTAERTYFVCADFQTADGKLYDLDFWVEETDEGLTVTESMVHKEEGKPRYSWIENHGIWTRKPLD
jgi:hypothetical protein